LSSAFGDVAGDVPLNYTGKLLVALGASVTVKTHIKHLYRKLGVRARHQAIVRGKEFGLL
jgi:ATP/maltotriose-dependent transcriptional regulator MalT